MNDAALDKVVLTPGAGLIAEITEHSALIPPPDGSLTNW